MLQRLDPLAIDPGFFLARSRRAFNRARAGDRTDALVDLEHPTVLEGLFFGRALVVAHENDRALDLLERVQPRGVYFWWLLR